MIVAEKTYRTFSSQNYRWVLPEVRWSESCSVMFDSLQLQGLYSPWNSPGQKTGVGSLSILQGIFPTQGLNPGLPHCWWILYQLSHKGSPYTKVRVKCLCPVGGERRVSSLLGFLKNLFKIHAGKNKYIKFTQEVAGAEDRGGEERSRQWGKTIDEEENALSRTGAKEKNWGGREQLHLWYSLVRKSSLVAKMHCSL